MRNNGFKAYWDFDDKPVKFSTTQQRYQMRIYYEALTELVNGMHPKDSRKELFNNEIKSVRKWMKLHSA